MFKFIKKIINMLNKEGRDRAKIYSIYKESLDKSYKEMNRKELKFLDVFYLSENKLEKFRRDKVIGKAESMTENISNEDKDTISLGSKIGFDMAVINSQIESENSISKSTEYKYSLNLDVDDIRKWLNSDKNNLKSYKDVNIGNYFSVRMPMVSGKLCLKTKKYYKNVYLWSGYYRNLDLYLAGNVKNLSSPEIIEDEEYLWDPSGDNSAVEFFNALEEYIREDKKIDELPSNMDKLDLINYGTARGHGARYGWVEMIVRCDSIKKTENGVIRIFGSPLIVSQVVDPGYGWYNLGDKSNPKYYEYDGRRFTGNVLKNPSTVEYRHASHDVDINRLKHILENKDMLNSEPTKIAIGNYLFTYEVEQIADEEEKKNDLRFCYDMKAFAISKELFYGEK
ncbi:hypothetical protein NH286_00865 [Anaerococcus sp. NML200574]|uniref:hypothetical protein n=1 Tax=Anaerococcus sp. NML200574 TaxID=2954486 RepID=UPI002236FCA3|nr:hypothetical protein [Anaerococcus sp. NML200574]MCW6677703.1 hypothetical protein [Anaerococcus sp. NML200574]